MKRRISLFIAVAVCVLLFENMFTVTVFAEQDETAIAASWAEQCRKGSCTVGTMKRALQEIENPPIDEIDFMDEYNSQNLLTRIPRDSDRSSSSKIYMLWQIGNVQYVEGIDDNHIFITLGLTLDENRFFYKILLEKDIIEAEDGLDKEQWNIVPNAYFVYSPSLKKSDFEKIKIGDGIDKVMAIENTEAIDEKTRKTFSKSFDNSQESNRIDYEFRFDGGTEVMTSYKILSDGMLIITYSRETDADIKEENDTFKVADVYFTEDKYSIETKNFRRYYDVLDAKRNQGNVTKTVVALLISLTAIAAIAVAVILLRKRKTVRSKEQ